MECVSCEGTGKGYDLTKCEECNGDGFFILNECPRKILGNEITEEINMAGFATKGHLPEEGGLLNQEAWFIDMWSTLNEDQAKIENEIRERKAW